MKEELIAGLEGRMPEVEGKSSQKPTDVVDSGLEAEVKPSKLKKKLKLKRKKVESAPSIVDESAELPEQVTGIYGEE